MDKNFINFEMFTQFLVHATKEFASGARVFEGMTAEQLDETYFLLYCVEEETRNIRETLERIGLDRGW